MPKKTKRKIDPERISKLQAFLVVSLGIDPNQIELSIQTNNKGLEFVDEALTHTSAQAGKNHERLEFLGDAVLRLAASEFIDRNYPNMEVGERSALRAQIVSDRWLAEIGSRIGIKDFLILGPKAARDISARSTIEAEATEALIGAIYQWFQSMEPVHKWLTPFWKESAKLVLADPHRQNSKSALQEWTQARGLQKPVYSSEEKTKGHGDQYRFFSQVSLDEKILGEGWGGSRRDAEKDAAKQALGNLLESA